MNTSTEEAVRPRLLDLFCGQGGAGHGYHLAGFDVTGVDIRPQRRHPAWMAFVQGDALEYLDAHGGEYDAIHASPPCRAYTRARGAATGRYRHPDLVGATREALVRTGRPWVIENVVGAPMHGGAVLLCGGMFSLRMYRHRLLEFAPGRRTGREMRVPDHPAHTVRTARMGRRPGPGEFWSIAGNFSGVKEAGVAMGMEWADQDGLRQAVPPVYTRWAGERMLALYGIA